MATHLFVAPSTLSFGELVLGLRLAADLTSRGDKVVFLAPAASAVLFHETSIAFEPIDALLAALPRELPRWIERSACDSLVIVDLMVLAMSFLSRGFDLALLDALPVPVYALDIWDLRRSSLGLDLNSGTLTLPESVRHVVPRRLVPVPFAQVDVEGGYNALHDIHPGSRDAPGEERVVLFSTSRFQTIGVTAAQKRVLATVPRHVVDLCLRADARVRVLHVGPEPIDRADPRYRFQPQLPRSDYERLLASADLVVTMNQSATSITTALALEVPALVAISNVARDRSAIVPFPFRVFPFGFVAFLDSLLAGNAYAGAIASADIVPGDAFVDAVRTMLFDDDSRTARLARMRAYTERVRELPTAVQQFDRLR
jgi:hypothetical protein